MRPWPPTRPGEETIIDKNSYRQLQEALALCHEVLGEAGDLPSE